MKKNIILLLSSLMLTILFSIASYAQTNYANVKVDELSDAQILQIMKQGESIGYTNEAQLIQLATARGMKVEEIEKFKLRAAKLKNQGTSTSTDKPVTGRESSETSEGGNVANEKQVRDEDVSSKIFGSDLFRNGNITFEPNLRIATPRGYIIGPDDKLLIDLTGDNEVSYNLAVSTEGVITLPYVGRISVLILH
jgi:hypothetical protein